MKFLFLLPLFFPLFGCASTYTIDSFPTNSKVSIDGEAKGETPFTNYESSVWLGTSHRVAISKEGYETKEVLFKPRKVVGQRVILAFLFPPAWLLVNTFQDNLKIQLDPEPKFEERGKKEDLVNAMNGDKD